MARVHDSVLVAAGRVKHRECLEAISGGLRGSLETFTAKMKPALV
jgi:hypothetical protein